MPSNPIAHAIRFGPYCTPRVTVGEEIQCEVRGMSTVHSWRDCGDIMWPLVIGNGPSPGRPAMALTGDLVRALQRESASAIAKYWSTSRQSVRRWRRALGVGRNTEGTSILLAEYGNPDLREYSASGTAASLRPEVRKRRDVSHSSTLRNKPGWPKHMGELGKKGGKERMRSLSPAQRIALAKHARKSSGKNK